MVTRKFQRQKYVEVIDSLLRFGLHNFVQLQRLVHTGIRELSELGHGKLDLGLVYAFGEIKTVHCYLLGLR